MTGIRRMPCIQTFIVRQRVIGELPDSIHNVVPKRADIGQITWIKVPDGQDPPDFLGGGQNKRIGLELIEWLDGGQMGPAKTREARRMDALRVLRAKWNAEYAPQN